MALLPDKENEVKQLSRISELTREDLAELIGVSTSQIHLWLIGKQPSPARLERIRELLAEYQGKETGKP